MHPSPFFEISFPRLTAHLCLEFLATAALAGLIASLSNYDEEVPC
jgi:hypothetical protein